MDYAVPKAEFFPPFELDRTETLDRRQPARRQGRRRDRHDRVDARGRERGDRRARAARHHAPRHAADARARLAGDRSRRGEEARCTRPVQQSSRYHRPTTLDEAIALLAGDADAKPLAGGHSLLPRDEAPARGARRRSSTSAGSPGSTGSPLDGDERRDRRPRHPRRVAASDVVPGVVPGARRGGGADRRPPGAQPRHDRRQPRATPIPGADYPTVRDGARRDDLRDGTGRRAVGRGRRLLHRRLHDRARPGRADHLGARARDAGRHGRGVRQAPPSRVGLRGRRRRRRRLGRGRLVHRRTLASAA